MQDLRGHRTLSLPQNLEDIAAATFVCECGPHLPRLLTCLAPHVSVHMIELNGFFA